jgi:Xaa-Pro dipeptidase
MPNTNMGLGRASDGTNAQAAAAKAMPEDNDVFRKLRKLMKARGCDALIALSQDNVTYTAGFLVPSHATNRFRRTITIIAGDSFAAQIVVNVEEKQARTRSRFKDVRSYSQFDDEPADVLALVLTEAGVADSKLAIELDFMPARDFLRLAKNLPKASFFECNDIYFEARMIKTDEELAILRKIGALTDRVIGEVFRNIQIGMSEIDVSRHLVDMMLAGGSNGFKYRIGSGANSSIVNCGTTAKRIEKGDVIRIEILGDFDNYRSNVTRTAVAGTPTAEQKKIWATLMKGRDIAKGMLKPGARIPDVYRAFVHACREEGIEPTLQFLGHGIGLTVHEEPYVTETRNLTFEPNIAFTMEPLYMVPGRMGFHHEDMYVITCDGFDPITGTITPNDDLIEVG